MQNKVEGSKKVLPSEGQHTLRCFGVIDLGTQKKEWKGNVNEIPQIMFLFETVDEWHEFTDAQDNKISKPLQQILELSVSWGQKANLRKYLEDWLGRGLEEKEIIDFSQFAGAYCNGLLKKKVSAQGNERRDLTTIMPVNPNMSVQQGFNQVVYLDLDNYDQGQFDNLQEWIQRKVAESPEFQNLVQQGIARPWKDPRDERGEEGGEPQRPTQPVQQSGPGNQSMQPQQGQQPQQPQQQGQGDDDMPF